MDFLFNFIAVKVLFNRRLPGGNAFLDVRMG